MLKVPTYIAAFVVTGALLAACGGSEGPSVAGSESGTTTTASDANSGNSGKDAALKYSKCMRKNGVPSFPDPDANGEILIQAEPGDALDPDSPKIKSAQKACYSLTPQPSEAERKKMQAEALKFAQCMRENGVRDFPDPEFGEGPGTRSSNSDDSGSQQGGGQNGPDPDSPTFKSAAEACKKYAPGGEGPTTQKSESDGGGPSGGVVMGDGS